MIETSKKQVFIKVCCSEWNNASRDKRELSICNDLGMRTLIIAKGDIGDKGRIESVDGFCVHRYSTRPLGKRVPSFINRLVSLFTWAKYIRSFRADLISGHDLSGLTIAWISTWFCHKKPKLIYDSHEFEIGRTANRSLIAKFVVRIWEKIMINISDISIMVNDCIADEVTRIHKLKTRPLVVRNIPSKWNVDKEECKRTRGKLISTMPDINLLLMYHGGVSYGRGIEDTIDAIEDLPSVGLIILGNPMDECYYNELKKRVSESKACNRIIFHEAVSLQELWKYVGAADIGMCNINPVSRSYYYALPNKFFENIQALTPVIVSDLPEMRRIVDEYNIGLVCQVDNVRSLKESIEYVLSNREILFSWADNEEKAKNELCWEKEKKIIYDAYFYLLKE